MSSTTRFRCDRYSALGLHRGNVLYKFQSGTLTTDEQGGVFIRATDYFSRGVIVELAPKAAPARTCPDCRASFATDADLHAHLQHDHGTATRNQRAELATLARAAVPPTGAAGGAPEPWSVCEVCGQYYQPRQINQSSCSPRCRYRRYRARKRAAQATPRNGHVLSNASSAQPGSVALRGDVLTRPHGAIPGPKTWHLKVHIDPALGLAVHRIARMRRETVSVTVDRLLRVGVRRYKRTHGTDGFEDLPELRSGAGRLGRARRRGGPIRLVDATPEEAAALITVRTVVCEAARDGNGEGDGTP